MLSSLLLFISILNTVLLLFIAYKFLILTHYQYGVAQEPSQPRLSAKEEKKQRFLQLIREQEKVAEQSRKVIKEYGRRGVATVPGRAKNFVEPQELSHLGHPR